jgi:hypothetical protein
LSLQPNTHIPGPAGGLGGHSFVLQKDRHMYVQNCTCTKQGQETDAHVRGERGRDKATESRGQI